MSEQNRTFEALQTSNMTNTTLQACANIETSQNPSINALIAWYFGLFIPDPKRGYALMNPPGADAKYIRKYRQCDLNLITQALLDRKERKLKINNQWIKFPHSVAVTPQHTDGWATMSQFDVDQGGHEAIQETLAGLQKLGIWAFAQLGESQEHAGGHIYIPSKEALPSEMLHQISEEIKARFSLQGEAYPCNRDLRLPLMPHLRAPQGPTRYPLMLPNGELIDAQDPLEALARLHQEWTPNDPERLTSLLSATPTLYTISSNHDKAPSAKTQAPTTQHPNQQNSPLHRQERQIRTSRRSLHRSKITASNPKSVIKWFNERHDLSQRLGTTKGITTCPWHEDKTPSLGVWQHDDGRTQCRCLSKNSNCPAASEKAHWDAFDLYCYENNCTPSEAVRQISRQHKLGQKYTFKMEVAGQKEVCKDALVQHFELVDQARKTLEEVIEEAATLWGQTSVVKGTPGVGKTYSGARLANKVHREGKRVSIVCPSHNNALREWAPQLEDVFIWEPRSSICTCFDKTYLKRVSKLGYTLPKCQDNSCPYLQQYETRKGRITIYQHNHLHINEGKILEGSDLIIIDESITNSLLEEKTASIQDLLDTMNHLRSQEPNNPALPLLNALVHIATNTKQERVPIKGSELLQKLCKQIGSREELLYLIEGSQKNFVGNKHPLPPEGVSQHKLLPQFFGKMLEALKHDLEEPDNNSLSAFTQKEGKWFFSWFERHSFLKALQGKLLSPAVILLDGSADESIYQKLLGPWKVRQTEIHVPLSPTVKVIQCSLTCSTRKIVQDQQVAQRTMHQVMQVCNQLDITLDGGISYKALTEQCEKTLGGEWLHYGGQRGSNSLAGMKNIALIASPTAPPEAIERKAMALFHDEAQLQLDWQKVTTGYFKATDPRLEAMNRIHGVEELHQSTHRSRPILAQEPCNLLIHSPWPLSELGLQPDIVIQELAHGNSTEAREAIKIYGENRKALHLAGDRADWGGGEMRVCQKNSGNSIRESCHLFRREGPPPSVEIEARSSERPLIVNTVLNFDDFFDRGQNCQAEYTVNESQAKPCENDKKQGVLRAVKQAKPEKWRQPSPTVSSIPPPNRPLLDEAEVEVKEKGKGLSKVYEAYEQARLDQDLYGQRERPLLIIKQTVEAAREAGFEVDGFESSLYPKLMDWVLGRDKESVFME